ncbi:hypothetical protein [Lyngbya sp. CCY1209]|uniref:hypothetical protein n=1 Tax=Lyngbya sp. CCY1209 TaxID=2886103 RepID=UPI002D200006|nr:hypothetical protein [Lyngbya sp. CCY1209]MEB3884101.1 hypothetical protein [Lyngbya sp. CCY1209]
MTTRSELIRDIEAQLKRIRRGDSDLPAFDLPDYRIPRPYLKWRHLRALTEINLLGQFIRQRYDRLEPQMLQASLSLWALQSGPVYCVDADLIEAFCQTSIADKGDLLSDLRAPVPSLLLLFPEGSIPTPDGGCVDFAAVNFWDADRPGFCSGSRWGVSADLDDCASMFASHADYRLMVTWAGMNSKTSAFASFRGIRRDGSYRPPVQIGTDAEFTWAMRFREIVLQSVMAIAFKPELISEEPAVSTGRGFGGGGADKGEAKLSPRWIGRGYQIKRSGDVRPGEREGAREWRVDSFWRRGHWRMQPHGEGRKLRKPIWIEPTLVRPES